MPSKGEYQNITYSVLGIYYTAKKSWRRLKNKNKKSHFHDLPYTYRIHGTHRICDAILRTYYMVAKFIRHNWYSCIRELCIYTLFSLSAAFQWDDSLNASCVVGCHKVNNVICNWIDLRLSLFGCDFVMMDVFSFCSQTARISCIINWFLMFASDEHSARQRKWIWATLLGLVTDKRFEVTRPLTWHNNNNNSNHQENRSSKKSLNIFIVCYGVVDVWSD